MSSSYGENLRFTIFGQSHAPAIGVTIEGIPAGKVIDFDALQQFMERRAPGRNAYSTTRKEADVPEFLCGVKNGVTCGAPITAIIRNTNTRSGDYDDLSVVPRPGHADYTAYIKFGGAQDVAGGGHFSGRLTAPLCIVGGICKQLLAAEGITVDARIVEIGGITGSEVEMLAAITDAKAEGDSVGGVVACTVQGLPAGLGDPMFGGMENRIASAVFGIPAVKGVEFGDGFDAARLRGSEHNDAFCVKNAQVCTETNHCGGILGGITNGMPLTFRVACKPTPSIAKEQRSVNLETMTEQPLLIHGRHDPCIVVRAVPCVEAAAAVAVYDAYLARKKEI